MEYLLLSQLAALMLIMVAETFNDTFAVRRFWLRQRRRQAGHVVSR